jgi:hypothetical protein
MDQLKEIEDRHEDHLEGITAPRSKPPSAHRRAVRPGECMRLVRVPGGFAYVADEPTAR